MLRPLVLSLLLVLALPIAGCGSSVDAAQAGPTPITGARLWADPGTSAHDQATAWRTSRPDDAAAMDRLASTPQATWLGDWTTHPKADTRRIVDHAAAAGRVPVLVTYDIPGRDCGGYSRGGIDKAAAYRSWTRAVAAGIGSRRVAVVVEPDALPGMDCLSKAARTERLSLLRDAVGVFAALPKAAVYVDAGNNPWHSAATMAERLHAIGAERGDGFALNVSNFGTTSSQVSYGRAILKAMHAPARLGFVVDTSRNGRGPTADAAWCNPVGRGIGAAPITTTGMARVHALLWVKTPGESDGECNGGPKAGVWWPEQALELVRLGVAA